MEYLGSATGGPPAEHGPRQCVGLVSFIYGIFVAELDGGCDWKRPARFIAFAPPPDTLLLELVLIFWWFGTVFCA